MDCAAMALNNPLPQRQAKTCPQAWGLGGEKRLEDALLQVGWNTRACISNGELHAATRGICRSGDGQSPWRGHSLHGLLRIGEKIHHDLLELMRISPQRWQLCSQVAI